MFFATFDGRLNYISVEFIYDNNNTSIIKVFGVGGCGCNALAKMYDKGIYDVDFIALNTDNQSLDLSPINTKLQLGPQLRSGLGSGSNPAVGKDAAIESADEIKNILSLGTKMLIITAGLGKGTGTGASPVIAKIAKEVGILTVAVVTTPFAFEGPGKKRKAQEGLEALVEYVDSYIIVDNQKVMEHFGHMPANEAYDKANEILVTAVKGLSEIITIPNVINTDFQDVKTVLTNSGVSIMAKGVAEGTNRLKEAVEKALYSPLLPEHLDIKKFSNILLNVSSVEGEHAITLNEIEEITQIISSELGEERDITFGQTFDQSLGDNVSLTIIATGFNGDDYPDYHIKKKILPDNQELNIKSTSYTTLSTPSSEPTEENVETKNTKKDKPEQIPDSEKDGYTPAYKRRGFQLIKEDKASNKNTMPNTRLMRDKDGNVTFGPNKFRDSVD